MARVLIVDDDEQDRLLQRAILESAGHEVFFARDGEEGVRTYMRKGIEVVVTDIMMPRADGYELMTVLGDFLPAPPVVAVSGKGRAYLDQAKMMGAVATLEKPIDRDALLQAVETALAAEA